jgi:hypothetical protein
MLEHCAPGHTIREANHCHMVVFNGKTMYLQRGSKSESDPELQAGNVRKLVRTLEIDRGCANGQITGFGV